MSGFRIKITGDRALLRKLEKLDAVTQRKVVRPAVDFAIAPVAKEAKARAPVDTGLLKKSIGKRVKAYKRSATVVGIIGIRSGFAIEVGGKIKNPAKYAHLVELGQRGRGARPFLRPAFIAKESDMVRRLESKVLENIKKQLKKAR